jgi:16S rRNA (uracil1498-N3)-methyltransferase
MNLFYANPEDVSPSYICLRGQEAKHAGKVLRHRVGDSIYITDGNGIRYQCNITKLNNDSVDAKVIQSTFEVKTSPEVTLLLGLVKKRDRLEFAIEKCVELGADRIVLYPGDHSEKERVRLDRVEAAAKSAMKQSLRYYLPEVTLEKSLESALNSFTENRTLIAADETTSGNEDVKPGEDGFLLIVGPEGGFSKAEREIMQKRGVVAYSLGSKRLRTETAAITMVDRFKNVL